MNHILPDLLVPGLRIVFCGTAAGNESARQGAYYAHPGNRFWRTLYEIGLTPRRLLPEQFPEAIEYGIGLTDLAKSVFGNDDTLKPADFDPRALSKKIIQVQPRVLAFTSKTAGRIYFGVRHLEFGKQLDSIGTTIVFVLPSPSGLARRSWNLAHWHEAANFALR